MNVIQVKLNVDIQHFRCLCLVANFHIFLTTKFLFVESLLMPLGFTNTEEKVSMSQFNLRLRQSYSATHSLTLIGESAQNLHRRRTVLFPSGVR